MCNNTFFVIHKLTSFRCKYTTTYPSKKYKQKYTYIFHTIYNKNNIFIIHGKQKNTRRILFVFIYCFMPVLGIFYFLLDICKEISTIIDNFRKTLENRRKVKYSLRRESNHISNMDFWDISAFYERHNNFQHHFAENQSNS